MSSPFSREVVVALRIETGQRRLCSTGRSSLEHLTYQLHDGINHACQEAYDHQNRYQNIGEKVSVLVDLGAHSQSQASRVSVLEDLNFRTCCDWVKFSADEFSLLDVVVDLLFEFLKLVAEARTWWRAVGRGFGHRGTVEAGVGAGEETAQRGARTG